MNPLLIAKLLMYGLLGITMDQYGHINLIDNIGGYISILIPVVCIDVLSAIEASR